MPAGRPTKYDPKYCDEIVKYFDRKAFRKHVVKTTDVRTGREYLNEAIIATELPTLERFAYSIGVDADTLLAWTKSYPEFLGAVTRAKNLQKHILVTNGLLGYYNSGFAQFVAKNFSDMRDKQEREISGTDGGPIQVVDMSRAADED